MHDEPHFSSQDYCMCWCAACVRDVPIAAVKAGGMGGKLVERPVVDLCICSDYCACKEHRKEEKE